jgi:crotonobetainyl-CoA:carnitine CoA-transferase CaiB-like acyl-CoA transferase
MSAAIFAGLRVVELGGGAAGPVSTRYFADYGATVIRVESRHRPDFLRTLTLRPDTRGGLDASLHFAVLNPNKLSVALNMSLPEGVAAARRLALSADVVAENFSPKAMAKWGLDYESLHAERPDLVMISTCLYGQTGPERMYAGFGGQGSAIAGYNYITGWPDRAPLGPFGTITDSLSPRLGALLVASALLRRRRTGEGQYVDLSQVEGGVYCLAESIVRYSGAGDVVERRGYRSEHVAPHAVLPCRDRPDKGDRWVAVVCHDDEDWRRLRAALGDPSWSREERFATNARRLENVEALEQLLASWTRERDAEAIVERLQDAGVEAGLVADNEDLHHDPQLAARRHFRPLDHPVIGRHVVEANAMRFSATPEEIRSAAPRLGEHTEHVFRELLGMPEAEFRALAAKGVFE